MKVVVGGTSGWLHLLVWIGLLGLIASFHGIIMGYSRQIYALARAGFLPSVLARVDPTRRTPHWAILAGGVVGIAAIYSDSWIVIAGQPLTASIVTMSALGAIVMYLTSLASLFRLRRTEPHLDRPYRTPAYPLFPWIAAAIAVTALVSIVWNNVEIAIIFTTVGALGAAVTAWRLRTGKLSSSTDRLLHHPGDESTGSR